MTSCKTAIVNDIVFTAVIVSLLPWQQRKTEIKHHDAP